MKTKIKIEKEIDIKKVVLSVAVNYEDEDIPYDFPLREGDMWNATIDIDTGVIEGWPQGQTGEMYMKVCDQGTYRLLDDKGEMIAEIVNNYVPNELIPGDYGDYIDLKIDETGKITNWRKKPSFDNFFED